MKFSDIDRLFNQCRRMQRVLAFYNENGLLVRYKRSLVILINLNDRINEYNRKVA